MQFSYGKFTTEHPGLTIVLWFMVNLPQEDYIFGDLSSKLSI